MKVMLIVMSLSFGVGGCSHSGSDSQKSDLLERKVSMEIIDAIGEPTDDMFYDPLAIPEESEGLKALGGVKPVKAIGKRVFYSRRDGVAVRQSPSAAAPSSYSLGAGQSIIGVEVNGWVQIAANAWVASSHLSSKIIVAKRGSSSWGTGGGGVAPKQVDERNQEKDFQVDGFIKTPASDNF